MQNTYSHTHWAKTQIGLEEVLWSHLNLKANGHKYYEQSSDQMIRSLKHIWMRESGCIRTWALQIIHAESAQEDSMLGKKQSTCTGPKNTTWVFDKHNRQLYQTLILQLQVLAKKKKKEESWLVVDSKRGKHFIRPLLCGRKAKSDLFAGACAISGGEILRKTKWRWGRKHLMANKWVK